MRITLFIVVTFVLVGACTAGCPDCQTQKCILPRLVGGGCAQGVCVPNSGCGVTFNGKSANDLLESVDEALKSVEQATKWIEAALNHPLELVQDELGRLSDALAKALDVTNTCNTKAVKDAFTAGGWTGYFGKRIWDSKSASLIVGSIIPATSAAAVDEVMRELKAQYASFVGILEKAAQDIGENFEKVLEGLLKETIDSLLAGKIPNISVDKITFGLKVNVLRVECKNRAVGVTLPSEGNFQLALAWRIDRIDPICVRPTPCDPRFKRMPQYNADCKLQKQAQKFPCFSAVYKACSTTFNTGTKKYGGVVNELGCNSFGVSCYEVSDHVNIEWADLTKFHGDCTPTLRNWFACLSAAHNACVTRGNSGAGILVDAGEQGSTIARLACFQPTIFEDVPYSTLQQYASSCIPIDAGEQPCVSAINRFCHARGQGGGIGQELGASSIAVACFAQAYDAEPCFA